MNIVWIVQQKPVTTGASPRHTQWNADGRSRLTGILELQHYMMVG